MTISSTLLIAALVVTTMGATASLDQLIKQVPARHRIGVVAYSAYSRAADFHTGLSYYVPIIVGWVTLIPAAATAGWRDGASGERALALAGMVAGLASHMLVTALFAAPTNIDSEPSSGCPGDAGCSISSRPRARSRDHWSEGLGPQNLDALGPRIRCRSRRSRPVGDRYAAPFSVGHTSSTYRSLG